MHGTLYIERDTMNNPFIFKFDREIEYETSKYEFAFRINISIMTILRSEHEDIRKACVSSLYFQPLTNALFHNMIWNEFLDSELPKNNVIEWKPSHIEYLEIAFQIFKNEPNKYTKCDHLFFIIERLYALNYEFDNLRRSNFRTMTNLIPSKTLLSYAYNFTMKSKLTSALDFSHWFKHNFFEFSKLGFKVDKNDVYVTIIIPLYSQATLLKVYAKPILHNNVPYLSNSITQFLIENQTGINYFSSFEHNCFYANNKTFCKKLTIKNDCDHKYLSESLKSFDESCFDRQLIKNTIMQIKNDIYFLVFEPMSIEVNCSNAQSTIRLNVE